MYFFFFQGIQYLCSLQDLNLYYNNIPSLVEVSRLQPLPYLKELDLRLNPVVRKDTDYRLFAVYTLQTLEKLGEILPPLAFLQELDWSKLPLNLWKLSQSVHWQETFVYQSTFMELCVGRMYDKYFYCLLKPSMILSVTSTFSFVGLMVSPLLPPQQNISKLRLIFPGAQFYQL